MKSATATVLIALSAFTLFVGATASFVDDLSKSVTEITSVVTVSDEDKQVTEDRIKSSEDALAAMKKLVADAEDIDTLIRIELTSWLTSLAGSSAVLHPKIRVALQIGSVADMKATAALIRAAVELNKRIHDEFNKKLPPGDVKDGINKGIPIIINDATATRELLESYPKVDNS